MEAILSSLVRGIAIGAVYAMVALPIVIMMRAMRVFNFAVGAMLMMLAWVAWSFNVQIGLPFWLSVVMTMVVAAILGILTERLTLRFIIGQSLLVPVVILLSMGNILTSVTVILWNRKGPVAAYPDFISAGAVRLGPIVLSQQHLIFLIVGLIVTAAFYLFFRYTRPGLAMRAVSEDHQATQAMGISVTSIMRNVTILAYMMAGLTGVLFATINGVNFYLGELFIVAMVAAMIGGLNSVVGLIVAGLIVGVVEQIAARYLDPLIPGGGFIQLLPLILLVLIMLVKPAGLFGEEEIKRI